MKTLWQTRSWHIMGILSGTAVLWIAHYAQANHVLTVSMMSAALALTAWTGFCVFMVRMNNRV